jgi:uncharacterized protein involved in type VI secretion and phage assembly
MRDMSPDGGLQQYFGLYPAIVTDLVDPQELGRVEVKFPWLGDDGERGVRTWATLLSPYADDDQGFQVLPEVGSQVVVAFEAGNLRRPYVVGSCWNGKEALPERPQDANNKRLIKTRSGSLLEFDDASGAIKITLSTSSGHQLILDAGGQEVTVRHSGGSSIALRASGKIEITANAGVDINAPVLNVHSPIANFDGIIKCATLIASTSVVSPSYTPGAGNVW